MDKFFYQCTTCGKIYETDDFLYLCPECSSKNRADLPPGGVLKILYNYNKIRGEYESGFPFDYKKESRSVFKERQEFFHYLKNREFMDLLPIMDKQSLSPLHVGNTPLYCFNRLKNRDLIFNLLLKDDSQNPTFSFKDRASTLVSAYAKEKSIPVISAASTGNAGSSIAGICASQHQKAIVFVPASAPVAKLAQILLYGAVLVPVNGSYDNAFDLCTELSNRNKWFNRNTAYNPLTIEGKKTVSYELFDQLNGILPDKIFVPTGDGVILSGIFKGFEDLLNLGIIDKIPVIISVQSQGSSNLIDNHNSFMDADKNSDSLWKFSAKKSKTIADSISVDIPRNFYMASSYLARYRGETCKVSDNEILFHGRLLAESTGIFAEPSACASFAGMMKYYESGKINEGENVVVLLTASGLKDIKAHKDMLSLPQPINPTMNSFQERFGNIPGI